MPVNTLPDFRADPRAFRDTISIFRTFAALSAVALLSACAGHAPPMTATQEAATYLQRAKPEAAYTPPGPPSDPWRPYIEQAATRFDVPERWIREVMRVESAGQQWTPSGVLTTSPVGAMGLMQLMPETYDEVRARYGLGDDAYDPKNNIFAGTAYIREMYDAFGSPGFLAAYNGGPARLEDYLVKNRPLPTETRRYVAMIAPYIQGIWPANRSPAEQYAVNQLPMNIPPGPRYVVHHVMVARNSRNSRRGHETVVRYAAIDRHHRAHGGPAPIELAEAPELRGVSAHGARVAYTMPVSHHGGFHLIDSAMASETMGHHAGGPLAIRVGAFSRPGQAHAAAGASRHTQMVVATVKSGRAMIDHAHLPAVSHVAAAHVCHKLSHSHGGCLAAAPTA